MSDDADKNRKSILDAIYSAKLSAIRAHEEPQIEEVWKHLQSGGDSYDLTGYIIGDIQKVLDGGTLPIFPPLQK